MHALRPSASCDQDYPGGYAPVRCAYERSRARVVRWFSGSLPPGRATASSCGLANATAAVTVLSSPNPSGGPWTCLGGVADAGCSSNGTTAVPGFSWSFDYQPNSFYFFGMAPGDITTAVVLIQMHLTVAPTPPPAPPSADPAPPPPPAPLGSWQNPHSSAKGPRACPLWAATSACVGRGQPRVLRWARCGRASAAASRRPNPAAPSAAVCLQSFVSDPFPPGACPSYVRGTAQVYRCAAARGLALPAHGAARDFVASVPPAPPCPAPPCPPCSCTQAGGTLGRRLAATSGPHLATVPTAEIPSCRFSHPLHPPAPSPASGERQAAGAPAVHRAGPGRGGTPPQAPLIAALPPPSNPAAATTTATTRARERLLSRWLQQ